MHWKVAGAAHNPKGITVNWLTPLGVVKAVFGHDSSATGTCQYPHVISMVVIYFTLPILSNSLSILGIHRLCISEDDNIQPPIVATLL